MCLKSLPDGKHSEVGKSDSLGFLLCQIRENGVFLGPKINSFLFFSKSLHCVFLKLCLMIRTKNWFKLMVLDFKGNPYAQNWINEIHFGSKSTFLNVFSKNFC